MERKERDALRLYYSCKMELDNAKARINELVDRCSSLVSQNEMLESNYKEMTRDRDWCKERIKELEREKAALLKTQEFHLERIKELGTQLGTQLGTRWIPAKDRPPTEYDEGTDFLVTNGFYCVVCEWRGYWNNDPFCGDKVSDEVTHWMPLPPPPKEEGK